MDVWFTELYFNCLAEEAYSDPRTRREYEGCLRVLHEIPFYWVLWQDEDRAGDALSYRQYDFLSTQGGVESFSNPNEIHAWGMAAPTVLEVLLAMARRWSVFYGLPTHHFFNILMHGLQFNRELGFHPLPYHRAGAIKQRVDIWLSRQFAIDGTGSPFPLVSIQSNEDMRRVDIWSQMNAFAAQHPHLFT